ncbi:MAG: DUF2066 domain-containing protein, partial [Alphaproteobacteria bacterium]|nr:DUF2066 domain-containing protein [Alphaproteobacteria bacterium]
MSYFSMPQLKILKEKVLRERALSLRACFKCAFSAVLLCTTFGFEAQAEDSVFVVPAVTVQEQAESEVEAKDQALVSAKKASYERLIKMLVPLDRHGAIPNIDPKTLENLVYTTNITRERMSQGQGLYVADIQISFRPDLMRDYFKKQGVAFAETISRRLLILPILTQAGASQLWEDSNEWRLTWASRFFEPGLVPTTQALGDISDIGVISAQQAMSMDPERLKAIAAKYEAE